MISIWLIPAPEDAQYLQAIINNLAASYQAPVFSPHCTLYSSTDLPVAELKQILERSAEDTISFVVDKEKINHTENIWKTVFIELIRSPELEQLQQAVISQFPEGQPYEFLPHISLIYKKMTTDQQEQIIRNLAVRNSYKMDRVTAMKTGPDIKHWEKVAEVQFHA